MSAAIDMAWLSAAFLLAIRIGPLFVLAPVFGTADIPVRFRVLLALAFAAMLAGAAAGQPGGPVAALPGPVLQSPGAFMSAAMGELAIGVTLVFGVFAAFAAFLFGGRLLDIQVGFGVATLLDPVTRGQAPLLGTALNLLGIAVFLALDGHHLLIRGIAWSMEAFPPGRALAALDAGAVVRQFGLVFAYGLMIVAPAVIVLLLLDVGLAVAARTMPQMNIFIVAMPLKVVVGVLTLALSMRYLSPALARVYGSIGLYWRDVLG